MIHGDTLKIVEMRAIWKKSVLRYGALFTRSTPNNWSILLQWAHSYRSQLSGDVQNILNPANKTNSKCWGVPVGQSHTSLVQKLDETPRCLDLKRWPHSLACQVSIHHSSICGDMSSTESQWQKPSSQTKNPRLWHLSIFQSQALGKVASRYALAFLDHWWGALACWNSSILETAYITSKPILLTQNIDIESQK